MIATQFSKFIKVFLPNNALKYQQHDFLDILNIMA